MPLDIFKAPASKPVLSSEVQGNDESALPYANVGGRKKKLSKMEKKPKSNAASKKKKGGALAEDLQNLAVPFAILLAKEGLENMFKEKKTKAKKAAPSAAPKKRRGSIAGGGNTDVIDVVNTGGSCGSSCALGDIATSKKKGGSKKSQDVKEQFNTIAREIQRFLDKY